ncbi:MAG: UPF0323 family lipoprotein [Helicobacter sp.]|nr:UPF0323 family lipoprotein [Helicobacter sp.]
MKHFRKIKHFAIGSLSCMAVLALSGCDFGPNQNQSEQKVVGAVVILEQQQNGKYKVLEEYPAASTHIIVRNLDGSERVLSKAEVDELIKQEQVKIDSGKSELLQEGGGRDSGAGLGLGGAILASAAGAILGSYIGNKLFNNPAFNQNSQRNYKSPQAYERSKNSFSNANLNRANQSGKSGFFNNSKNSSVGG